MPKPTPAGPHSDLKGVNMDARTGVPNRDPALGTAKEKGDAEAQSKGRPKQTENRDG